MEFLRMLATRGVTKHKPLPVVTVNSPHPPSEGGYRYGYIFPAEIETGLAPLAGGFPVLVVAGRQVL